MSWKTFLNETVHRVGIFEKEAPDTFKGFGIMAERAKRNGVLGQKTKEFIALGMAVSTRCDSCIGFTCVRRRHRHDARGDGRRPVDDHLHGRRPGNGL